MCIKRRAESSELVPEPPNFPPPPPPYFNPPPPVPVDLSHYPYFPRRTMSDPMYMMPCFCPWPPTNPPWPHLPPLPPSENLPLSTPIAERTARRPNLYSLQEFLHEESQDQQTHDPCRTLRSSHITSL